ncbi:MAG: DUF4150 domain-containing protein [Deltaproteobacteria bacterium]|nr:DUF4150 domain-containing protein [Deltaproteobacteria bacterium]
MLALTLEGGLAASGPPDVCKVSDSSGQEASAPLPNLFQMSMSDPATACQKIFFGGAPACNISTKALVSLGDEKGTGGGLISSRFAGPGSVSPASASGKVILENKPAVSMGAQTHHNGDAAFNTVGCCPLAAQIKVLLGS